MAVRSVLLVNNWQFCFLDDSYYQTFPNHGIMESKEKSSDGRLHDRPCFFAFQDGTHKDILWLVPISSRYDKYKAIYDKNIAKYGRCTFIRFGEVLGSQAAFLIQNMCPVTHKYIREVYLDKNNNPVMIDNRIVQDVISNAKTTLAKVAKGSNLVFTKVMEIKEVLLAELKNNSAT